MGVHLVRLGAHNPRCRRHALPRAIASVENMNSHQVVAEFLKRQSWHLVQYIDLGTTALIFVVEKANERYALKTRREVLSRLHRYRSCVQSLLWLNDEREGLDAIGRAHFERQLSAL
jgi:hypothetical protein